MKREDLFTFKNVVLDNGTFLRVGDIIQTDVMTRRGVDFPVLDAIESSTDPLISQVNLNNAKYYGNTLLGDSVEEIQARANADVEAAHRRIFHPTEVEITADQLAKRLNAQAKPPYDPEEERKNYQFFTILGVNYRHVKNGIMASLFVISHQNHQKIWLKKIFKMNQERALATFRDRMVHGQAVYGEINADGWIKFLYPCHHNH